MLKLFLSNTNSSSSRRWASNSLRVATKSLVVEKSEPADRQTNHVMDWTPSQLIRELDQYIIGQHDAKKRVAVALRNRFRRQRLPKELRDEISPRNILMVGTTGVGKTEIARRLARISNLPFLRVESTQFTEVGFVGRDVQSIIGDLVKVAAAQCEQEHLSSEKEAAAEFAHGKLLAAIHHDKRPRAEDEVHLRNGLLDSMVFLFELPSRHDKGFEGHHVFETARKECTVAEAREAWKQHYLQHRLEKKDHIARTIARAEEGIVFIDEIDKICDSTATKMGGKYDCSGEGVQRDLLPLIEGTSISVDKVGTVNTDNILFIAAGAFSSCKPSDMLPELQGRLPVRVNLCPLSETELERILVEPKHSLLRQQEYLLGTEGAKLVFEEEAVREMARSAAELNRSTQNLGARRLQSVVEQVMEDLSYELGDCVVDAEGGVKEYRITKEYVEQRLARMMSKSVDMRRFII